MQFIKPLASGRNDHKRLFPYLWLQGFPEIVPGKAGNGSAGGFVNSTFKLTFVHAVHYLTFWTWMIYSESIEHECIRI